MTSHKLSTFSYGKDDVRVLRIVRSPEDPSSQQIIEYTVQVLLGGNSLTTSYTEADNSKVVATDTVKNTINLLAKKCTAEQILCPEKYALVIINHFITTYSHIENVFVDLKKSKWTRIVLEKSGPHKHSFVKDGNEIRTVCAIGSRNSQGKAIVDSIKGGIKDLVVLKSSGSAFYGFWRDEYTTLQEVNDRIFSTSVECEYDTDVPKDALSTLLESSSKLPPFCDIQRAAIQHILTLFSTHSSPSVQATQYQTSLAILDDTTCKAVSQVSLTMPNRHYIPIDLKWAGLENLKPDKAEVFLPSAHPSGLIKSTVIRGDGKARL